MGPDWLRLVAALACGVAGFAVRRRGFAPASAAVLFAGAILLIWSAASETVPGGLFALSLLTTPLAPCVIGVAGLWWPVRRPTGWLLAAGVAVLAGSLAAGLLHSAGLDTRATGCSACPVNPLLVPGLADSAGALDRTSSLALVLSGALLVAGAAVRWWRAPPARHHDQPALAATTVLGALTVAGAVHALALDRGLYDAWQTPIWNARLVVALALAGVCLWRLSLPRRTADRVARTVLGATPAAADLAASLAREIGDPGLRLTYRRPDGSRIDADGTPTAAPDGRGALRLTREGTTYAEVWHDPRLDPDLVRAAASSSGLALEYVAAQARLRAETADAVAARRRVVERGDAERSRLERDLHDGAQQGLIALSVQVTAGASPHQDAAQREITAALHDLRTIARGLFPVSLTEAGLTAALRELGDHTTVPLVVEGGFAVRPGVAVDTAFFEVVADVAGVTQRADSFVRVELAGGGEEPARIRVTSEPVAPADAMLVRAEDRVVALGGTLVATSTPEGLVVEAEVPCGS
jgi:signal transduction histidine kinase